MERILDADIPHFPFTRVAELPNSTVNKLLNIRAIIYNVEPESETPNPKTMRVMRIVDDTLKYVTLRLFGDLRERLDNSEGKCVTVLNVELMKDHTARWLDSVTDTKVILEQDSDRVRTLQKWFDERGRGERFPHVGK